MTFLTIFILTSTISVTSQSCPGIDGGFVPWWILYQQKERPFIHYYVDSTNKEDIVVHYPEKEDSVLARVIHPLVNDDTSQYIIYFSDLVNVVKIATSLGKPTHSKWMHGILATDTSWTSGTWLLSNNLLFPPTNNGDLLPPTAKQWILSTIGDSGADIFYVCISADNRNDIDNILQTVLAGNPFIFTQKLNRNAFIKSYLQDIQTPDTSFGLEQSANMFLDCMYATLNETMQKCLYRYSVDEGLAVEVFTRPRGMIKHSRAFCHKTDPKGLYEFGVQKNIHSNNPEWSNSMFILSDQSNSGATGKTCFGQDIGANTETVAIMICAQLPSLYKNLLKLSKISSWTCQSTSLKENQESFRTQKTSLLSPPTVHFSKTSEAGEIMDLHDSATVESDQTHGVKRSTSVQQTELTNENDDGDDTRSSVTNSAVDSESHLRQYDYKKLCELFDCSSKPKKRNRHLKKIYKDPIKKSSKVEREYDEMVYDIQMVEKNDERTKTNKIQTRENPSAKAKSAEDIEKLMSDESDVLALICREGCQHCPSAKNEFRLMTRKTNFNKIKFVEVDVAVSSFSPLFEVGKTPALRFIKNIDPYERTDYVGTKFDDYSMMEFLATVKKGSNVENSNIDEADTSGGSCSEDSPINWNENYIPAPKVKVKNPGDIEDVIIGFETVNRQPNLKVYDAQPKNPKVKDLTIGYGFNLNRDDAKATFMKVLEGVDFDMVRNGEQKITKEQALKLLKHDLDGFEREAKGMLGHDLYDSLPPNVKSAVISAMYRGDLKRSHKTVTHMKNGEWKVACIEYLNYKQYKDAETLKILGIRTRMNWNMEQFSTMFKR